MSRSLFASSLFMRKLATIKRRRQPEVFQAVLAAKSAIWRSPTHHDGRQPAIGFSDAVRKVVPTTSLRIVFRYEATADRIELLDLASIAQLDS